MSLETYFNHKKYTFISTFSQICQIINELSLMTQIQIDQEYSTTKKELREESLQFIQYFCEEMRKKQADLFRNVLGELVKGVYEIGMGKFGLCEDYASVSGKVNGGINSASTNLKENVQVHMNNMDMGINNGNIGNGSMQIQRQAQKQKMGLWRQQQMPTQKKQKAYRELGSKRKSQSLAKLSTKPNQHQQYSNISSIINPNTNTNTNNSYIPASKQTITINPTQQHPSSNNNHYPSPNSPIHTMQQYPIGGNNEYSCGQLPVPVRQVYMPDVEQFDCQGRTMHIVNQPVVYSSNANTNANYDTNNTNTNANTNIYRTQQPNTNYPNPTYNNTYSSTCNNSPDNSIELIQKNLKTCQSLDKKIHEQAISILNRSRSKRNHSLNKLYHNLERSIIAEDGVGAKQRYMGVGGNANGSGNGNNNGRGFNEAYEDNIEKLKQIKLKQIKDMGSINNANNSKKMNFININTIPNSNAINSNQNTQRTIKPNINIYQAPQISTAIYPISTNIPPLPPTDTHINNHNPYNSKTDKKSPILQINEQQNRSITSLGSKPSQIFISPVTIVTKFRNNQYQVQEQQYRSKHKNNGKESGSESVYGGKLNGNNGRQIGEYTFGKDTDNYKTKQKNRYRRIDGQYYHTHGNN